MKEKAIPDKFTFMHSRRSLASKGLVLSLVLIGVAIPAYNKGTVLLAEVLFLSIFPVLFFALAKDGFLRIIWILAGAWSTAQVISDWTHGTEMFSAPTFAGLAAALLATALKWITTEFNISPPAILLTVGIGWTCLEIVTGETISSSNPWKYGLATPIVVTIIAFAYFRKFRVRSIVLLLLALAAASLLFDSRFETGLLAITAVSLIVSTRQEQIKKPMRLRIVLLIAAAFGLYLAYPSIALSGIIGDRALQQQLLYVSRGTNFLLGTRLEFPQMLFLVSQNPWLGIGSYAHISSGEAYAALGFLNSNVSPLNNNEVQYLLNPVEGYPGYNSHSSAMAAALFAGIWALPFWIFVIGGAITGIKRFLEGRAMAPALFVYMCGLTLWDAVFSPLSTRGHVSLAVTIFLLATTFGSMQNTDTESFSRRLVLTSK